MAIYPKSSIPKWQPPVRITRPYIKPNFLADTIGQAIQGYGTIQNANLKNRMFAAQLAKQQQAAMDKQAYQKDISSLIMDAANQRGKVSPDTWTSPGGHGMDQTDMVRVPGVRTPDPTLATTAQLIQRGMPIGQALSLSQSMNPQRGLTFQDLKKYRTFGLWADQDAAKNQAIIDALAKRTGTNLNLGISGLGEGDIHDYQISPAGEPLEFASDPATILRSLFPQVTSGWRDKEGNLALKDPSTDSWQAPYQLATKYEQVGGQLGWEMFVEDYLKPYVKFLQNDPKLTDKAIQIKVKQLIKNFGRSKPGGAFDYKGTMSEIGKRSEIAKRIGSNNTNSKKVPTVDAEKEIYDLD